VDRTGKVKINRTEYLFLLFLLLVVSGIVVYFSMFYEPPPTSEIYSGDGSGIVAENSGEIKNANASVKENMDPASILVEVPEEYFSSINAGIRIEQLRSLKKLVSDMDVSYEGTPCGVALVGLCGIATDIDANSRTLLLEKEGDRLRIYIGKATMILTVDKTKGGKISTRSTTFEQIEKGDELWVSASLQFGRGDPLFITSLIVHPK
jgi:hypothetical protein